MPAAARRVPLGWVSAANATAEGVERPRAAAGGGRRGSFRTADATGEGGYHVVGQTVRITIRFSGL